MKTGASLTVGDRTSPLEADLLVSMARDHSLIGKAVRVSPVAEGRLQKRRGETGEITGVVVRYGEVVCYEISIDGDTYNATLKDVFTNRQVLEDIQPATSEIAKVQEALAHWMQPRTYWESRIDGLENLFFEMASLSLDVHMDITDGLKVIIPNDFGDMAVVPVTVTPVRNAWMMTLGVCWDRSPRPFSKGDVAKSHWVRTFELTQEAADYLWREKSLPWGFALEILDRNKHQTKKTLRPLFEKTMRRVLAESMKVLGRRKVLGPVHVGFSDVRLPATAIGLTEPPSDRRPYTVVSISPRTLNDPHQLQQVVLHECIHIAVASTGGEPHNAEFMKMAEALGLDEEYRN